MEPEVSIFNETFKHSDWYISHDSKALAAIIFTHVMPQVYINKSDYHTVNRALYKWKDWKE